MNQRKEAKQRNEIARMTQKMEKLAAQRRILVKYMQEIRDIARICEGVELYAKLADKALDEANQ
jgi:hypothetical protein